MVSHEAPIGGREEAIMAPKADGYWTTCAAQVAKACSKSGKAGADRLALSGKFQGQAICGGCASSLKVKRSHESQVTDLEAQRASLTKAEQATKARQGTHKALYARELKGGIPDEVRALVGRTSQAKAPKAPKVKAPAKAPAKVAPKAKATARKAAKVA